MAIPQFSPWGLKPLSPVIFSELNSRAVEYGINLGSRNLIGNATSNAPFSGPRTAWVRVCSNGNGINPNAPKDPTNYKKPSGFIMGLSSSSFLDSYGFNQASTSVIGYGIDGSPHLIQGNSEVETFPHRPPPGIISIETEFNGAGASMTGLSRKATIKWKCSTLEQLEYMTPYFLTPKISVIIEWGWSNYNPSSLIDLSIEGEVARPDLDPPTPGSGLLGLFTNSSLIQKRIEDSHGNYDAQVGIITSYGYTINATDGFDCWTVVQSPQFLADGIAINNLSVSKQSADKTQQRMLSFPLFINKYLDTIGEPKKLKQLNTDPDLVKLLSSKNYFSTSDWKNILDEKIEGKWIRMDLFADIFNYFLAPKWSKVQLFRFDIKDIVIMGHPLLKSVDKDVLIPNAFSPKLLSATAGEDEKGNSILDPKGNIYGSTMTDSAAAAIYGGKALSTKLASLGLTREYDDLDELLNNYTTDTGEPTNFPRLENRQKEGLVPGYYGYLKDIFISTTLIKDASKKGDTAIHFLREILQRISHAACDLWEFKIVNDPDQVTPIKVIDMNFSKYTTPASLANSTPKVPVFIIGDVDHACLKEFTMNTSVTGEMAMQALMGQAANKAAPTSDGTTSQTDMKSVLFVHGDRLFSEPATIKTTQLAPSSDTNVQLTDRSTLHDFFAIKIKDGKDAITYLLTERDSGFMADLIKGKVENPATPTVSNMVMPGTELTLTSLGIGGIRYLDMFGAVGVPAAYRNDNAVWQVDGVRSSIQEQFWTTTITAKVRPLTIVTTQ